MTLDEQIQILQALKEGLKIEAKLNEEPCEWFHWTSGDVSFARYDYRIVPEPRRFIIFKYGPNTSAIPYAQSLPDGATIVCIAVEEPNLGESVAPTLEALKQTLRSDEEVKADGQEKIGHIIGSGRFA